MLYIVYKIASKNYMNCKSESIYVLQIASPQLNYLSDSQEVRSVMVQVTDPLP